MTANIIKYEKIDMEMLETLLSQPNDIISTQIKKQLLNIQKNIKISSDKSVRLRVEYNYGAGKENLKIGRIYAKNSLSLGSMNALLVRNPMTYKYYWDIDQVCAHFSIAKQFCEKNSLPNKYISEYVEKREDILLDIMKKYEIDRKQAKTLFIKIGYGGSILPDGYDDFLMPHDIHEDDFLIGLKKEMKDLSSFVYKLKVDEWGNCRKKGDSNIFRQSGANKEFKMLSVFLQDKERELLLEMVNVFTECGRQVDILIHDGCMIQKNSETEKSENIESLFTRVETVVEEKTGYKIKLAIKPISQEFIPEKKQSKFETSSFWLNHFVCDGKLYHEHRDTKEATSKDKNYLLGFAKDLGIFNTNDLWQAVMSNPSRKYTYMDWVPFGDEIHPDDYNVFQSPVWVKLFTKNEILNSKDYFELLEKVRQTPFTPDELLVWEKSKTYWQIKDIFCYDTDSSKNQYKIKYLMNYLANMIFHPEKRVDKMLFLRNRTGGCGKTKFMERSFAEPFLGEHLYKLVSKLDDVFGDKNFLIHNKIFLILEEVEVKEQNKYDAVMKSFITSDNIRKRKMYTDTENVKNYLNFYGSSNKNCPVLFDPKNMRRYPIIDCKEYKLTKSEQIKLEKESKNPEINKLLFKYILSQYEENFNFEKFPVAESTKNMERQFTDNITLFFKYMLNDFDYSNTFLRDDNPLTLDALMSFNEASTGSEWIIRSDPFFHLLGNFLKKYKGDKFDSSIHQLRNSNDWMEFIRKYGSKGLNLFTIRDKNKKPHYFLKIEELKKYFPSLDSEENEKEFEIEEDNDLIESDSEENEKEFEAESSEPSPKRQCLFNLSALKK